MEKWNNKKIKHPASNQIAQAILFGSLATAAFVSFIFENLAPALMGAAGAVGALALLIFNHCYQAQPELSGI